MNLAEIKKLLLEYERRLLNYANAPGAPVSSRRGVTAPQVIWLTKAAEDELALFFVEKACSLFDEAEV
jgi:hypothetical protein